MRTHGRVVSEDALTRTLDHWLTDGPREMPDEVLADALRAAATTSQRRFRGWFLRMTGASSPAVPVGLTVAAITAVVAVAIGLGLRNVAPPPGESSPTASPTAPAGLAWFRNEADGYEVLIPSDWEPRPELESTDHVRIFGNALEYAHGAMIISVGDPNGMIDLCDSVGVVVGGGCTAASQARTLDELGDVLISKPASAPWQEQQFDTVLDGLPARIEHVMSGGTIWAMPTFYYLYTILEDGRPLVIAVDYWLVRQSRIPGGVNEIRESFHLVGPSDPSSPTASVPGLRFELPQGWGRCSSETGAVVFRAAGDCRVGTQHTDTSGGLTPFISVRLGASGDPPTYCTGPACTGSCPSGVVVPEIACEEHSIRSLSGLWSYVKPSGYVPSVLGEADVEIDGVAARLVTATRTFLEGRIVYEKTWLLILRDRPYVLQLSAERGSMPEGWIDQVIASMEFTD